MIRTLTNRSPKESGLRHIPLKTRLLAWWHGYDAEYYAGRRLTERTEADQISELRNFQSVFDPVEQPAGEWTAIRSKVVQDIWTRGFIVPGGEEYAAELMAGCGLNAAETLLEIGVGFGGSTRAVIQRYGNYVTCHERDPALVKEARRQAAEFKVADKLEITTSNPEKAKFKSGYFRAALLRETLYTIDSKAMLLERVRNALKRGESQLVITDLMFAQDAAGPELARWMKAESIPAYPYSLEELISRLGKLGFVIRIAEDESRVYRRMIIDAWKAYLETIDTESLPTEIGRQVVHEAEFWSARIAAIDAGALKYVHVVGVLRNS